MSVGIEYLSAISSSYSEIKKFFNTSSCYTVLKKVADAEADAAYDILYRLDQFVDKRQALNRVLGHLESAHQLHRQSWMSLFDNVIGNSINEHECYYGARYRDMFICIYIAILHKYLGESNSTIQHYLGQAEEAATSEPLYEKFRQSSRLSKLGFLGSGVVALSYGPLARIPVFTNYVASGKYEELLKMKGLS